MQFADLAHNRLDDPAKPRSPLASLVGLATALVLPVAVTASVGRPAAVDATQRILIGNVAFWCIALLQLTIVLVWEKRSLASIGLVRPSWKAILAGVAAVAGLAILSIGIGAAMKALGFPLDDQQQNRSLLASPVWLQAFVVITAGVTEEILFRGYALERVIELTRSRWLGVLVPVFAFGAIHIPFWGVPHAVVAGTLGLAFALIYLWRRNLWTNITSHVLIDTFGIIVLTLMPTHGA
jgi:membrane protease YdiL (CAAX protease family)